jgi:hypothetical protein
VKFRGRLAVNKQGSHRYHYKEKYCVEVSNGFEALEDLDNEVNISGAWENIRQNI